ncbi:MAG: hypothetical protein GY749_29250, partial [Desulfobacteraceae bacterium]|nr:hypothetical protein [Desulfobacteraceae bacterium]
MTSAVICDSDCPPLVLVPMLCVGMQGVALRADIPKAKLAWQISVPKLVGYTRFLVPMLCVGMQGVALRADIPKRETCLANLRPQTCGYARLVFFLVPMLCVGMQGVALRADIPKARNLPGKSPSPNLWICPSCFFPRSHALRGNAGCSAPRGYP